MKTKTIGLLSTLLLVLSVSFAGAFGQVTATQATPIKNTPMNIDGVTGNFGFLPNQYMVSNAPVPVVTTPEEALQQKCKASRTYVWKNVIDTKVDGYKIENCILYQKTEGTKLVPCGRMIQGYDEQGNKLPYKVHAKICNVKDIQWNEVKV